MGSQRGRPESQDLVFVSYPGWGQIESKCVTPSHYFEKSTARRLAAWGGGSALLLTAGRVGEALRRAGSQRGRPE